MGASNRLVPPPPPLPDCAVEQYALTPDLDSYYAAELARGSLTDSVIVSGGGDVRDNTLKVGHRHDSTDRTETDHEELRELVLVQVIATKTTVASRMTV